MGCFGDLFFKALFNVMIFKVNRRLVDLVKYVIIFSLLCPLAPTYSMSPSYLIVECNIYDAQVYINDILSGNVNDKITVNAGNQRIVVSRSGYKNYNTRLTVHYGKVYRINVKLEKLKTQQQIIAERRQQNLKNQREADLYSQDLDKARQRLAMEDAKNQRAMYQSQVSPPPVSAQHQQYPANNNPQNYPTQAPYPTQQNPQTQYQYPQQGTNNPYQQPTSSGYYQQPTPQYNQPNQQKSYQPPSYALPPPQQMRKKKRRKKRKKAPNQIIQPPPKQRSGADYALSFLPLGIPQFRHEKPLLGVLFFLMQAGGGGAAGYFIYSANTSQEELNIYITNQQKKIKAQNSNQTAKNKLIKQTKQIEAEYNAYIDQMYLGQYISFGVAGAGYLFSVMEALIAGPKPKPTNPFQNLIQSSLDHNNNYYLRSNFNNIRLFNQKVSTKTNILNIKTSSCNTYLTDDLFYCSMLNTLDNKHTFYQLSLIDHNNYLSYLTNRSKSMIKDNLTVSFAPGFLNTKSSNDLERYIKSPMFSLMVTYRF